MYIVKDKEGKILGYVDSLEKLNIIKFIKDDIEAEELMEIDVNVEQCFGKILTNFWNSVHENNPDCHEGCIAVYFVNDDGQLSLTNGAECKDLFKDIQNETIFNNITIEKEQTIGALTIKNEVYPDSMLKWWNTIYCLNIWNKDWYDEKNDYYAVNLDGLTTPGARICILLNDEFEFDAVVLPEASE